MVLINYTRRLLSLRTKRDVHKVPRNFDPSLHPFEIPREYTRALNATKLERVFAKPFIGSLEGHQDGVHCMLKHPKSLSTILSGACNGEVKVWNLPSKQCQRSISAHSGFVRGLCMQPDCQSFFSVGDDKTIKQWKMESPAYGELEEPVMTILGKTMFLGIDHHWKEPFYATCGDRVDIWDETRTEPMRSFTWGLDSITSLKFNHVETNVLASTANDRNIVLYDMRGATPLRKVILEMRSNAIAWNPMEAFIFTVANEDYNLYTFDMRNLSSPTNIHMDHVSAVLDVDYSPTGKEIVSGSYDKTIRIFPANKGRSREVYHTKRMQRVTCVRWTMDNKYILSGSDEMNIRIWKSAASEKLGVTTGREQMSKQYNEKLKATFAHHPQIRRVARHRHVPKSLYSASREIRIIRESKKRKEKNARAHSKPGTMEIVPERQKHVVGEHE
ncbi:PREDICTED: DDB1- and CUL4-associated factor 13-like [Priapulus caudatus]|uniref:DDB1- and CUL4-associated factor 13 n=1 Tax=Priapulus caudatus TaxID=37621 RepID=A0ABM1E764_PRICU|nr:PREDICTED: DDB1- and CUL4-associated factor 13-like [Priapulus caudatus]